MAIRILLTCLTTTIALQHGISCANAEEPILLRYKPVREIVYAVHTNAGPKTKSGRFPNDRGYASAKPFMIYRQRFEKQNDTSTFEGEIRVKVPHVFYNRHHLDLTVRSQSAGEFSSRIGSWVTYGGPLPLKYAFWKATTTVPILWSHIQIVEEPLLFPAFGTEGTKATVGTKWETPLPPFLLLHSIYMRLIKKKLKLSDLMPIKMTSQFTGWRTFRRRKCAEIKFSMDVKSNQKIALPKEKATFTLNGTSIFDPELGWALMTEYKAKGLTIDEQGKKHDFFLERREVLVSVKTFEEGEPQKRPSKPPAGKKDAGAPGSPKKNVVRDRLSSPSPDRPAANNDEDAAGRSDDSSPAASPPKADSNTKWTLIIAAILVVLLIVCGGFLYHRIRPASKKP